LLENNREQRIVKFNDKKIFNSIVRASYYILPIVITLCFTGFASAQQGRASVQQTVTIEIRPITQIVVTGNPHSFLILDPPAGPNAYATVTDNNTSYSFLSNIDNMKIVTSIDSPMPPGTKLMVNLGSTQGKSAGMVDISNAVTPVTAVSGLRRGSDRNQSINYTFAANASAGNIEMGSRIITLTVTN
jgi:hypothetical protein